MEPLAVPEPPEPVPVGITLVTVAFPAPAYGAGAGALLPEAVADMLSEPEYAVGVTLPELDPAYVPAEVVAAADDFVYPAGPLSDEVLTAADAESESACRFDALFSVRGCPAIANSLTTGKNLNLKLHKLQ